MCSHCKRLTGKNSGVLEGGQKRNPLGVLRRGYQKGENSKRIPNEYFRKDVEEKQNMNSVHETQPQVD